MSSYLYHTWNLFRFTPKREQTSNQTCPQEYRAGESVAMNAVQLRRLFPTGPQESLSVRHIERAV